MSFLLATTFEDEFVALCVCVLFGCTTQVDGVPILCCLLLNCSALFNDDVSGDCPNIRAPLHKDVRTREIRDV